MQGNLPLKSLDINDEDDSKWPHNLRVSRADLPHLEKVYSNWRRQLKREAEAKMEDHNKNTMIWRTFMLVAQQAAVHLGIEYLENLHSTKNQSQRTMNQSDVTKKLVSEQTEIHRISLIVWQEKSWKRTILFNDQAVQLSTAKVYVFSDSVLSMRTHSVDPVFCTRIFAKQRRRNIVYVLRW